MQRRASEPADAAGAADAALATRLHLGTEGADGRQQGCAGGQRGFPAGAREHQGEGPRLRVGQERRRDEVFDMRGAGQGQSAVAASNAAIMPAGPQQ